MRDINLFQIALGLTPLWVVESSQFNPDSKRLDIVLAFPTAIPGRSQSTAEELIFQSRKQAER